MLLKHVCACLSLITISQQQTKTTERTNSNLLHTKTCNDLFVARATSAELPSDSKI